jgi:hypothetical protein
VHNEQTGRTVERKVMNKRRREREGIGGGEKE